MVGPEILVREKGDVIKNLERHILAVTKSVKLDLSKRHYAITARDGGKYLKQLFDITKCVLDLSPTSHIVCLRGPPEQLQKATSLVHDLVKERSFTLLSLKNKDIGLYLVLTQPDLFYHAQHCHFKFTKKGLDIEGDAQHSVDEVKRKLTDAIPNAYIKSLPVSWPVWQSLKFENDALHCKAYKITSNVLQQTSLSPYAVYKRFPFLLVCAPDQKQYGQFESSIKNDSDVETMAFPLENKEVFNRLKSLRKADGNVHFLEPYRHDLPALFKSFRHSYDHEDTYSVAITSSDAASIKASLLSIINEWETESEAPTVTDQISCDAKFLPVLIGKGGTAIANLREKHNVDITIRDGGGYTKGEGCIVINGNAISVAKAKEHLEQKLLQLVPFFSH